MLAKSKGFTLIELIIVLAVIGVLAAAIFVALDPTKRFGEAQNALRDKNCEELEKCFASILEANNYNTPTALAALTLNTPYMLVTAGGLTTGATNCQSLSQNISRVDLASLMEPYVGPLPTDPLATTSDDTGYYVKRTSDSNFYVDHCYEYTVAVAEEEEPPAVCGNGILEGDELCDSDLTNSCPSALAYYQGSYVGTVGVFDCNPGSFLMGCNATCNSCVRGPQCEW